MPPRMPEASGSNGNGNDTKPHSRFQIAINLADAERLEQDFRMKLLSGSLDRKSMVVMAGKPLVETAVFCCPLNRAAVVCDVIRNDDKRVGRDVSRVYVLRGKMWVRLLPDTLLTIDRGGEIILNPDVFPPDILPQMVNSNAPRQRRIL